MLLPGMTPMVNAGTAMQQRVVVISNAKAKADRLDIRNYGPGCSERGWPYYEASCIRDAANALAKRSGSSSSTTSRPKSASPQATDRGPGDPPASLNVRSHVPSAGLMAGSACKCRRVPRCKPCAKSAIVIGINAAAVESVNWILADMNRLLSAPRNTTNSLKPARSFPVTLMQPTVITS